MIRHTIFLFFCLNIWVQNPLAQDSGNSQTIKNTVENAVENTVENIEDLKKEYKRKLPSESPTNKLDKNSVVHINKGCPLNSGCEQQTGIVKAAWEQVLQNSRNDSTHKLLINYVKQKGLPVGLWLVDEISNKETVIVWDSPCKHHRPKKKEDGSLDEDYLKKEIYIGEFFIKNFKDLDHLINRSAVIPAYIYYKVTGEIHSLKIPRGERPSFLDGSSAIISREEDGVYYHVIFHKDGSFNILEKNRMKNFPQNYPRDIACPKELIDMFAQNEKMIEIYQEFICKEVWDIKTSKYTPILYGKSCL